MALFVYVGGIVRCARVGRKPRPNCSTAENDEGAEEMPLDPPVIKETLHEIGACHSIWLSGAAKSLRSACPPR